MVKFHPRLSLSQLCTILGIHRSGLYYKSKEESSFNLHIMRGVGKCFVKHPYYGIEGMTNYLNYDLGYCVNIKRVRRLYKLMGLRTIYAKPKTTIKNPINLSSILKKE